MKGRFTAQRSAFDSVAKRVARMAGHPMVFAAAVLLIVVWLALGPIFQFSDTWQLVVNTATTIVTFLMVFLIQNTQNRDSDAIQIKLDELIRASKAHNVLLNLEELSQDELDDIRKRYVKLAKEARKELNSGKSDEHKTPVKA